MVPYQGCLPKPLNIVKLLEWPSAQREGIYPNAFNALRTHCLGTLGSQSFMLSRALAVSNTAMIQVIAMAAGINPGNIVGTASCYRFVTYGQDL